MRLRRDSSEAMARPYIRPGARRTRRRPAARPPERGTAGRADAMRAEPEGPAARSGPAAPSRRRRAGGQRVLLEEVARARDDDLRDVGGELRLRLDDGGDPLDVGLLGDLALDADDRLRGLLRQVQVL